jgi:hypothetical protein
MGNLSELLTNPSTPDETLQALVTAVLEDEASAYGGGLSGSVTPGFLPIFVGSQEIADSSIDSGVTTPDALTIDAPGENGLILSDSGGGGIQINETGGELSLLSDSELLISCPSDKGVQLGPLVGTVKTFNAGTAPLPDPWAVPAGTEATVSDALAPTYMGPYVGGGSIVCKVITDGATGWFTLSGAPTTPTAAPNTVSVSYEANPADSVILYSGVMDGSQAITLPTAGLAAGKIMTVKVISTDTGASALNVATSNAAEYAGNPQLFTTPAGAAMGGVVSLVWDGSAWWLLEYSQ